MSVTGVNSGTVARAFAAAADYDRHARVQRLAARALASRIAALPLPPHPRVLEIGCGTGFLGEALREEGVGGNWTITDLAPAMVERARSRLGDGPTYAVLDGEHDTPVGGPFDLICSSLATQWFADEPAALARWRGWLAPGGHVMVSTLGPSTFAEWRAAHEAEGLRAGTPEFTPPDAFTTLAEPPIVERICEDHTDARAFLRALHAIGAQTSAPGHRPLSPAQLRRVMRRFEAGGARVTYEVVTCHFTHAKASA